MRIFFLILLAFLCTALTGCGTKNYKAQLDFMRDQIKANTEAEASRSDRLAEREAACAGLSEAGAISACMLGITATTLADRSGGGAQSPFVMPPAPPKSGLELATGIGLGFLDRAIPGFVAIRQSADAKEIAIAQSGHMYGFLESATDAWTGFGADAINGMQVTSVESILGMRDVSVEWARAAPDLRPSIFVSGTGNNVGDGNTSTVDQSRVGRDRITQRDGGLISIDQSRVGRDRVDGANNRLNSDDIQVDCRPVAGAGAPGTGGDGGDAGNNGGLGGAVSQVDCSVRRP